MKLTSEQEARILDAIRRETECDRAVEESLIKSQAEAWREVYETVSEIARDRLLAISWETGVESVCRVFRELADENAKLKAEILKLNITLS